MSKKEKIIIVFVGILLLVVAAVKDLDSSIIDENGGISRDKYGGLSKDVDLTLDADGLLEDYDYKLTIEPEKLTKNEASEYFVSAREELDKTFCAEGDSYNCVTKDVSMKETYLGGLVSAEWYLDDYNYISNEGVISSADLPDEGAIINAKVIFYAGNYSEIYEFSFRIKKGFVTDEEELIDQIGTLIDRQNDEEGKNTIVLPTSIDGCSLRWKSKKSNLALRILVIEIVALMLIPLAKKEQRKRAEEKRQRELLLSYPDIVSKLSLFMGCGMSIKEAWNKIVNQYTDKIENGLCSENAAFEEMLMTSREIKDGGSERVAYQGFADRTGSYVYHRFVRILIQNLSKGNKGMCELLELESEKAFEERKLIARKLGEEAGTKLLFPLMIMMGIVMAVVLMPAVLQFF